MELSKSNATISPEERETTINFNSADLARGYFTFGTSQRSQFRLLCRRIGGQHNLVKLEVSCDSLGRPTYWLAQVPEKYRSRTHFGVRKDAALGRTKGTARSTQKVDSEHGKP